MRLSRSISLLLLCAPAIAWAQDGNTGGTTGGASTSPAPAAQPAPAPQSREDYQRALNQQVMSAPFNPGDVNKAQAYAVEAKQQGVEPIGVAPTYWAPGWTCGNLISYAYYNFLDYRNCVYYHYYYGRYWP